MARTRFERSYAALGRRLGDRLAEELVRSEALEPRLTPSRAGAYAIALAVDLLAAAFLVAGAVLVVATFPHPLGIVVGLIVASPSLLMAPKLGKLPKSAVTVDRASAPELFRLCDEIAAALETRGPDVIVVDREFNASWSIIGWRRRRVLTLGLALFNSLEPRERVALVAHELAHSRNGDASRGFVIGGALNALVELYNLIRPERRPRGEAVLVNWVFVIVSKPVWWLIHLLFHLLLRDSQRAEYLADALAARVAGSESVVSLHEKFLLHPAVRAAAQRAARGGDEDVFETLRQSIQSVSERERERRRRVARLEASRLDDSHPPTARRVELLERRTAVQATVTLADAVSTTIDAELAPHRKPMQEALIDDYRASVYDR